MIQRNSYLYIFIVLIILLGIVNIFLFYHIIGKAIFIILFAGIIISLIIYLAFRFLTFKPQKFSVSSPVLQDIKKYRESPDENKRFKELIITRTNYIIHKRILLIEIIIIIILLINLILKLLKSGG